MSDDTSNREPRWLNRFFIAAVCLAGAAVSAALFLGWRQGHVHHVADMAINLGGRPVHEHCTTCHLKGGRSGGESHPEIAPHSLDKLGCTGCHLGEGMALDTVLSHGVPGQGARRVLAGKDLQGSCFRCHPPGVLTGAEKAWRGYERFAASACDTCHHIAGLDQGGRYGPDLSDVGNQLGIGEIVETIRDPKKEPPNSIMPRFPLSGTQAREIAYFLKSRVKNPFYATPMQVQAGKVRLPEVKIPIPEDLPPEGEVLASRRCLGCHRFRSEDGGIAPDLTWIGGMRSTEFLKAFLAGPARKIPGAVMPTVSIPADEEERLIDFLASRAVGPVKAHGGADPLGSDPGGSAETAAAKHLYMALCQRCHAAAGDGFGIIQPNLANFPRAFAGNAAFFLRAEDERLQRSLEKGIPGTSMPPYGRLLAAGEREWLLDVIFAAFIGIPRGEKADIPPPPTRPDAPLEKAQADTFYKDLCARCHGKTGTGKGPEFLRYLPRPRNLTNRPYFNGIPDARLAVTIRDGVPGTAMPAFGQRLSAGDLWGMVDKVRSFSGEFDERTSKPRAPRMAP
jgi:mono/diheme cytochrome c family protein